MSKRATKSRPARREPSEQPTPPVERPLTWRDALVQMGVVFAVALVVRGLHYWLMRDSVFFEVLVCDARQYDLWAQRLAAGDWMGSEVFYQTPLYPYFLGVIYATFGHHTWAVRIVQALLGSAGCAFAARAGAGFFSNRVGWLSGLVLALYPPAIFFDGIVQKAALDLVFMTGLLWTVAAAQRGPRTWHFIVGGLLLGGMTLNRENAAVLVPLLAAWVVWLSWSDPLVTKLRRGLAMVAGLAAVLVPVGMRNYHVGGQFLLTTSQMGPNFYIGNHAGANGLYEPLRPGRGDPMFESTDARVLAEQDVGHSLTPKEISDYWMARSWQDIQADPAAWLRLMTWKWLLTWNTAEFIDAESLRVHATESPLLAGLGWTLSFGVLCPLAAAGIWFTRHDWRRLWVLYAMLLAFALAVSLFFVFARYRYPLVPVAALFAGAGAIGAWDRWKLRSAEGMRELVAAGALAAGVAIACNWPLGYLNTDAVTYITAANGLWDTFRPAEALELLKVAVEINPRSSEAYTNMGCAALKLGKMDDAKAYFDRAIALKPGNPQAHHGLGDYYEKQNNLPAAIASWRQSTEVDPLYWAPYRSLGHTALVTGDTDVAIRLLQKALELESKSAAAHVDLALAYMAQGKKEQAASELQTAVKIIPRISEANNLAWILATAPDSSLRDTDDAVRLAEIACEASGYSQPELLDTLAAAKANASQFDEAVEWSEKSMKLAREAGKQQLLDQLESRRRLYAEHRPFRDPSLSVKTADVP